MITAAFGALAAALAAVGGYLIYTSADAFRRSLAAQGGGRARSYTSRWLVEAGLAGVSAGEFAAAVATMALVGAAGAYLLFGAAIPAVVAALFCAAVPVSTYRSRRLARIEAAPQEWPRMLEELRLRTGSLGRSVPQALFEVGRGSPADWRPAFAAAEREWLLTTDFARTTAILKESLDDPTVDAVCETLLVAHEVGGADLNAKLGELIEDRVLDLQGRKDAASRQAGVRFARRFVLLVPLGMALAGLTIGSGRRAYESLGGQIAVAVGLVSVVVCWIWSARLMRLPREPRVFR